MATFVNGKASASDTSNTSVIAAQGSNVKTYLTDVVITNDSTTATEVTIKDGSTGKVTYPAPANGGAVHSLNSPIVGTANTAWQFAAADSVGSGNTITVTLVGFTGT